MLFRSKISRFTFVKASFGESQSLHFSLLLLLLLLLLFFLDQTKTAGESCVTTPTFSPWCFFIQKVKPFVGNFFSRANERYRKCAKPHHCVQCARLPKITPSKNPSSSHLFTCFPPFSCGLPGGGGFLQEGIPIYEKTAQQFRFGVDQKNRGRNLKIVSSSSSSTVAASSSLCSHTSIKTVVVCRFSLYPLRIPFVPQRREF